jgi:hypothetical protein
MWFGSPLIELLEVELGDAVERHAGDAAQDRIEVLNLAALHALVLRQDLGLRTLEDAVQAAQHGHGKDDLPVVGLLVVATQQVRDGPQKVGYLTEATELSGSCAGCFEHGCAAPRVEEPTLPPWRTSMLPSVGGLGGPLCWPRSERASRGLVASFAQAILVYPAICFLCRRREVAG